MRSQTVAVKPCPYCWPHDPGGEDCPAETAMDCTCKPEEGWYEGDIHPECQKMVDEYEAERRAEWAFRDAWLCDCGHLGRDHDHDEVGECSRCGCAAFHQFSQTGSPSTFPGEHRPALVRQRQTGVFANQSTSEGRPPSESVDSTSPIGIGEGQVAGGAAIPPAIDLEDPFDLAGYTDAELEDEIRDGRDVV